MTGPEDVCLASFRVKCQAKAMYDIARLFLHFRSNPDTFVGI